MLYVFGVVRHATKHFVGSNSITVHSKSEKQVPLAPFHRGRNSSEESFSNVVSGSHLAGDPQKLDAGDRYKSGMA